MLSLSYVCYLCKIGLKILVLTILTYGNVRAPRRWTDKKNPKARIKKRLDFQFGLGWFCSLPTNHTIKHGFNLKLYSYVATETTAQPFSIPSTE